MARSRNYKGNKSGRRDRDNTQVTTTDSRTGGNSQSWASRNQQLTLDAANLAYASVLGLPLLYDDNFKHTNGLEQAAIPGIMTFDWAPSFGLSTDAYSALNVASKRLYSYVRHANSGHSNYDSPDLMLYVAAMDSIYVLYAMGLRAYGLAQYYTMMNRYVPENLLNAVGFDKNLTDQLADFRMFLNTTALKISSMAVPNEFDIFKRHVSLTETVYADSPNEKSQIFAFTPAVLLKYSPKTDKKGGELVPVKLTENMGVQTYIELMSSLLEQIIADEDMNIMSGDILKAYGTEGIYTIGTIPEDYNVVPVFDMGMLTQIQNMDITPVNPSSLGISQKNNVLLYEPKPSLSYAEGMQDYKLLTVYNAAPTPEDTLNAMMLGHLVSEANVNAHFRSLGTEMVYSAKIYGRVRDKQGNIVDRVYYLDGTRINWTFVPSSHPGTANDNLAITKNIQLLGLVNKFQMHPTLYVHTTPFVGDGPLPNAQFNTIFGDVDNYTQVRWDTLKKVHDTIILSMLHVEGVFRR